MKERCNKFAMRFLWVLIMWNVTEETEVKSRIDFRYRNLAKIVLQWGSLVTKSCAGVRADVQLPYQVGIIKLPTLTNYTDTNRNQRLNPRESTSKLVPRIATLKIDNDLTLMHKKRILKIWPALKQREWKMANII